jgi:hypothetical protein
MKKEIERGIVDHTDVRKEFYLSESKPKVTGFGGFKKREVKTKDKKR